MAEEGEQLLHGAVRVTRVTHWPVQLQGPLEEVKMLRAIQKRQEGESRGVCGKAQQSAPLIMGNISHSWLLLAWGFAPHHH